MAISNKKLAIFGLFLIIYMSPLHGQASLYLPELREIERSRLRME